MHQCTVRICTVLLFQRPSYFRGYLFFIRHWGKSDKEWRKTEVVMLSCPVFYSQTSWSQAAQPPELEGKEQNEASIIQGEMVSDLLCHLDTWIHGARWNPLKELVEVLHWAAFHHLPAVLANWGIPIDWTLANVMPIYKKGQRRIWRTTGLSA